MWLPLSTMKTLFDGTMRLWDGLTPGSRFMLGVAVALLIWTQSASAVTEALFWATGLVALKRFRRVWDCWRQPAGLAFLLVALFTVFSLPLSDQATLSVRDLAKELGLAVAVFSLPAIFDSTGRIKMALTCTATAFSLAFAIDLVRLAIFVEGGLLAEARFTRPFLFNHPNVASIMAGCSIFVLAAAAIEHRRVVRHWAAALAGVLVCLAYLAVMASRGPQLAFVLSMACSLLLIPNRRARLAAAGALVLVGTLLFLNIHRINPRFMERDTMSNFTGRTLVWKHSWSLALQHPVIGHGFGKKLFVATYYGGPHPDSLFDYPHAHEYWLMVFFEHGAVGLILYVVAWALLFTALIRRVTAQSLFADRLLPGTILLMLVFIHLYAVGDYPDNIALKTMKLLVAIALVLIAGAGSRPGASTSPVMTVGAPS